MRWFKRNVKYIGAGMMAAAFISMRVMIGVESPVDFTEEELHYQPAQIDINQLSK